jgi:hypothetical protein
MVSAMGKFPLERLEWAGGGGLGRSKARLALLRLLLQPPLVLLLAPLHLVRVDFAAAVFRRVILRRQRDVFSGDSIHDVAVGSTLAPVAHSPLRGLRGRLATSRISACVRVAVAHP